MLYLIYINNKQVILLNIVEGLLISIGLAMDAFAVSICKGLSFRNFNLKKAFIVGFWFGLFQGIMPTIGFFLGKSFESLVTSIDHFVAFFLLLFIGCSMIKSAFDGEVLEDDNTSFMSMLFLSIATSIDALAVGILYVCIYGSYNAFSTFFTIGIITFIISFIGVIIGNRFGNKFKSKAELFGGFVLIFLGVKILLEHLMD